ncbi:MAG: alpha-L-arabinofuranosidase C-terminal domain-containing protein, partial [Bauldia sp.]
VWYHSRKQGVSDQADWAKAPPLLEDVYNFEDILLVGCALNTFIRRSDRVKVACIAQLVNVIAPIMTETGGPAWKQTIYYPLYFASLYGRGEAMNVAVDVPTYDAKVADDVPWLDASAVKNTDGKTITFFLINRHPKEALDLDIGMAGFKAKGIAEHIVMAHRDLKATNTARQPNRVVPAKGKGLSIRDGAVKGKLPPRSYSVVRVKL